MNDIQKVVKLNKLDNIEIKEYNGKCPLCNCTLDINQYRNDEIELSNQGALLYMDCENCGLTFWIELSVVSVTLHKCYTDDSSVLWESKN